MLQANQFLNRIKMEGQDEIEGSTEVSPQDGSQQQNIHSQKQDEFVWDQTSQLYYHDRSGFYHDPDAGWYYSTKDGLYYKFEDGNYILLDSDKGNMTEGKDVSISAVCETQLETICEQEYGQTYDQNEDAGEGINNGSPENHPLPSEWLEDTLIELYLSGYPNAASNAANDFQMPEETDERDNCLGNNVAHGQDSEWHWDHDVATDSGASWDEENWRAQYGQVVQQETEVEPGFPVIDMWDWSLIKEIGKEGNCEVSRIVGRLVQPLCKLHPSMPSGGRRLRTAPICRTHLDLVQVRSGQVYKLRTPNAGYLTTLSSYDASNPTKEWGFPELSVERINKFCVSKPAVSQQDMSLYSDKPSDYKKQKIEGYRDRAAERRALHGGFGVAPGQKKSADDVNPPSPSVEEAAAEALEMSFGAGSYAQKILKNMGWKEGEALGKTRQGLTEPLKGIGNKGTTGLGWDSTGRK